MVDPILDALVAWDRAGLRRSLVLPAGHDFCTNDYLGLAGDPRLAEAARAALADYGTGGRAARLLGGHTPVHAEAESAAARWQRTEAALLFPSGYHANLALLATVPGAEDLILSDARNHASLIDGARLGPATLEVFAHNDAEDLAARLACAGGFRRRYIVVESVYSMDGALAPLDRYAELAAEHDAWLIVDEAHAAGLYGAEGAGRAVDLPRVLARTITGGKALGVGGAFVVAGREVIEWLLNRGRAFVFTTAPLPALAAALVRAIELVCAEPARRERTHAAARTLRTLLARQGVEAPGESPIVPIRVGGAREALALARQLSSAGFDARAVRPPTVPEGESGLRLVCRADHDDATLAALAAEIGAAPRAPAPTPALPCTTPRVIVGTDTGVGKTVVAALLARDACRRGERVRYLKPVQTGTDDDTATVRALTALDAAHAPAPLWWFGRPASIDQAAAAEGRTLSAADVLAGVRGVTAADPQARTIIETAGGLLVPLDETTDQSHIVRALGAPCVLVARSGLGTLNHTLLTVEALRRRGIALRALFLVGPRHAQNVGTLRGRLGSLPLYELEPFAELAPATLDAWLAVNDLTAVWR